MRQACDKTLEKLFKAGKYWDGSKAVDLLPEQKVAAIGAFSPNHPDIGMLGLDDAHREQILQKVRWLL